MPMISYRAFTKDYGAHRAIDALTLDVERGSVVALLGPNGSGKTTSLKAAAGLVTPTSGEVLVGDPLTPARDPAARQCLSYLPQRVAFPESLTGREIVEFYRKLRAVSSERTQSALKFASLNGSSSRTVSTYSGGMVQRLGLAVAMVSDSDLLLLDEPAAALDPDGLAAFYDILDSHRVSGRTILFSSHQMGDIERLVDRFVVLVHGRLVASLTQSELRNRLAARGIMRVSTGERDLAVLERVRELAPGSRWDGDDLIVPGPADRRAQTLDVLRGLGVEVRSLSAEDGRLDALFRDLVSSTTTNTEIDS